MEQAAVILLAHGSSDANWQRTFEQLAAPTCQALPHARIAYMELCSPSLQDVVAQQVAEGAQAIKVVPLFLARGRHLRKDIPAMLADLQDAHPGVDMELTAPIGEAPALGEAVRSVVEGILERR
ncbi:CbiX/SirB N-terminal domain-containing protein [Marinobacteraceae bacterium S3BR75-40.1]